MNVHYILASAICLWVDLVHSQFYYSAFGPFGAPYTPVYQPQPYYQQQFPSIPQVATYSNFVPVATPPQSAPVPNQAAYRGFGYRTNFQDGASTTVYFVTGAEALKDFNKIESRFQQDEPSSNSNSNNNNGERARSLASDLLDRNAIPDISTRLKDLLQPAQFETLFENANTGVFNLYTFPASTIPLTRQSTNGTQAETITTTTTTTAAPITTTTTEEGAEAAESKVEDTRILLEETSTQTSTSTTTTTEVPVTPDSTTITTTTTTTTTTTEATSSAPNETTATSVETTPK